MNSYATTLKILSILKLVVSVLLLLFSFAFTALSFHAEGNIKAGKKESTVSTIERIWDKNPGFGYMAEKYSFQTDTPEKKAIVFYLFAKVIFIFLIFKAIYDIIACIFGIKAEKKPRFAIPVIVMTGLEVIASLILTGTNITLFFITSTLFEGAIIFAAFVAYIGYRHDLLKAKFEDEEEGEDGEES